MTDRLSVGFARAGDEPALDALLRDAELPLASFSESLASGAVVVARVGGRLVGCAALERFGSEVLLRSVALERTRRGRGLGRRLVEAALGLAAQGGATEAYLLTEGAETFFEHLGWQRIDRTEVPAAVAASVEFHEACPSSAVAMRRYL